MKFTAVIRIPDRYSDIYSSELLFFPVRSWLARAAARAGGELAEEPGSGAELLITRPVVLNAEFIAALAALSAEHPKIEVCSGGEPVGVSFTAAGGAGAEAYAAEASLIGDFDRNLCLPVRTLEELSDAEAILGEEVNRRFMAAGVRFINPASTIVSPDCEIGRGTVVLPNCIIKNGSKIAENCTIGPNSVVNACTVGGGTEVNASQINESSVGENVHVGPFAYIRPGCEVGNSIKVGDFVELKKAKIGDGTKISHLTYVGDAEVGKRVNFGCGTFTANYDGANKFLTKIGDDAFIGCNTKLIAPVTIGNNVYTAAGSTITDDVPDEALAIARSRQTNKPNWVPGYRLKIGKK